MALIPESLINQVRSNVNIVDIISQYVSLEKKGKDYSGLCPFHQEKTPSFTVSEEKQFFKCFGCGKGGNVFKFIMYQEDLTFPESVRRVAEFAHIEVETDSIESTKPANVLVSIHKDAAEFYHRVLTTTKAGTRGLKYAQGRGLTTDLLEHFQIGYAPQQDNLLLTFLHDKKYQDKDLQKSGLFVESKTGKLFDRFRDRLMFPLGNESGRIIGFSGRRLSDDKTIAKYVNSPETEIFTKSNVLFNFAQAKREARKEGHLILYEGYMDVIAAYKAGVKSGIASMGTSLTDHQVYLLRRVTNNIIINYDGDDPGVHAEERAAKMFQQAGGFKLGIVVLPEKLDPDEYVKKYGAEKYRGEIKSAYTPTDFFLRRLEQKYNLDNDREKLAYLDEAISEIAKLPNPVEQDLYIDRIATEQKVSQSSLKANLVHERRKQNKVNQHKKSDLEMAPAYEPTDTLTSTASGEENQQKFDPIQTRLIRLFINSEHAREYLLGKKFLFPDADYAKLADLWLNYSATHEKPTISGFLDFIPEQLQGIIVSAEMAEMPKDFTDDELDDQIRALNLRKINSQLDELMNELQDAKRKADTDEIIKITQDILRLKRIQGQREAF